MLGWTCFQGHIECAKLLISAGANVDGEGFAGDSPLITAARFDNAGVVEALVKAGADVNKPNKVANQRLV